tara:strand:- start:1274 stop:2164 length:891 start_codon:yes stop_codon:yes gene_type:complete
MRKHADLFYRGPNITPEQAMYNQNVSQLLLAGGVGLGTGGLVALYKALKTPSIKELAIDRYSTHTPTSVEIQHRSPKRSKPEEQIEEAYDEYEKAAGGEEAPFKPTTNEDPGFFGSDWSQSVTYPLAVALGIGGIYGGMSLGDYIHNKRREALRRRAIDRAKDKYEDALEDQYELAHEKLSSAEPSGADILNTVFDGIVKSANGESKTPHNYFGNNSDIIGDMKRTAAKGVGVLGALAVLTGIPAGIIAYGLTRKGETQRGSLTEAMRRRRAETARIRPQALYLTPGKSDESNEGS